MATFNLFRVLFSSALLVLAAGWARGAEAALHFNRDIRPILSENCFQCHGPDKNQRKADLRLDLETAALEERKGHRAIVPGNLDESELWRRITTTDEDDRMPPAKSGRKLSEQEISLLRRWIEQGAKYEAHWAFISPRRPEVPAVKNERWPRNTIDRFILARLEKEGLTPGAEADKRTLIRRVSFDLTGLPPTTDEVRSFLEDTSTDAYEKLVERLLSKPEYGERMAVYWLDLVRYADTDGFHADNYRSVYPYRDYVIRSFNDNLPFDQFTVEQIAGDLLPNPTQSQIIASTYNRLNRSTEEGGSQAKEYLAKYAADRVRTTSTVWMGATLGCAECHDHKFDPYTTRDFYSFAAFFADIKEQGVGKPEGTLLPNSEQSATLKRLDGAIESAERNLASTTNRLLGVQGTWEAGILTDLKAGRLAWAPLKPFSMDSKAGSVLELQEDLSVLAKGENPEADEYSIGLATDREHITALRLEVMRDASHKDGLGRADGRFVLAEVKVEAMSGSSIEWRPVRIATAIADRSEKGFVAGAAIDGKLESGWAAGSSGNEKDAKAAFILAEPISGGPGTRLRVRLQHSTKHPGQNLGRFRLALSSVDKPALTEHGLPADALAALEKAVADRTEKEKVALAEYYLETAPDRQRASGELNAARQARGEYVRGIPTTLATVAVEPRVMRVLPRGNWMDDSGPEVRPAVPEFLASKRDEGRRATRLDLARWLVSPENPLAGRAFVNRLWKNYFGNGITRVLDDLGGQGEWPKHPELLDWLSTEFSGSGWDIKRMVRLMVLSSTYRQTSEASKELRERDPYNRLLGRQSRMRLEAELVRDNALAVSGLLVSSVGGPSVKPYQPEGYWQHLNFPKRTYESDRGPAQYRRGLYTFWCRTFLHPSMSAFDASGREECVAARVVSNNPLQALVLLNDPTYVEAARFFAEQAIRRGGQSPAEKIGWIFARALHRAPGAQELELLSELFKSQWELYSRDESAARELLSVGEVKAAVDIELAELAAWTAVCRTVLNLHEMITRY